MNVRQRREHECRLVAVLADLFTQRLEGVDVLVPLVVDRGEHVVERLSSGAATGDRVALAIVDDVTPSREGVVLFYGDVVDGSLTNGLRLPALLGPTEAILVSSVPPSVLQEGHPVVVRLVDSPPFDDGRVGRLHEHERRGHVERNSQESQLAGQACRDRIRSMPVANDGAVASKVASQELAAVFVAGREYPGRDGLVMSA